MLHTFCTSRSPRRVTFRRLSPSDSPGPSAAGGGAKAGAAAGHRGAELRAAAKTSINAMKRMKRYGRPRQATRKKEEHVNRKFAREGEKRGEELSASKSVGFTRKLPASTAALDGHGAAPSPPRR